MAARFSQQTASHFNGDAKIDYDCRVNVLLAPFNCDRYKHSQRYTIQANVNRRTYCKQQDDGRTGLKYKQDGLSPAVDRLMQEG